MLKYFLRISLIAIFIFVIAVGKPVKAAFVPDCGGNCQLNDFLVLGINLINYMLAISGSLALLFFVWGGFRMLSSGGSSDAVEKGKHAITSAAIGILIVLLSWMIVNLAYTTLIENNSKTLKWWTTEGK